MATNNTGVDFDADLAVAVNDLTDVFVFSGTSYNAVIDPVNKATQLEDAGFMRDISFLIVVQTSLFSSTRPVANNQVTVGSVIYRIVRVETDEPDVAMTLFVKELTA